MFAKLFRSQAVVQRHLRSPLLQARLEYLQYCANQGYSLITLRGLAADLLLIQNLLGLATSSDSLGPAAIQAGVNRWVDRRPRHFKHKNGRRGHEQLFSRAVRWLRFLGHLQIPGEVPPAYGSLLEPYADYLRMEKGLSEGTIRTRHCYVEDFLGWFFQSHNSLRQITIADLDEAIARKGRDDGYARLSVRAYASSLRSFFRYAESRGWCTRGLAALVASPRVYQHENLPVGPSWSDVQRLIATTEGFRPKDIRDRAILLLLTVYALRSGEVRALKLEDLDWEKGSLFVPRTKGRKREPYPLSPTVGHAIIRYLKEARPRSPYREVFLTVEAPIQPLRGSSLWTIVAKRTLSLDPPVKRHGPHALRHASATHLLAQGYSLKEIGDHLGHRLAKTTAIYTKVNLSGLREVANLSLGGLL
jgi:site-specific recombinase XerD